MKPIIKMRIRRIVQNLKQIQNQEAKQIKVILVEKVT